MGGTASRSDHQAETTCLTRTCLHWTADGELSADDRQLVQERLQPAAPDQQEHVLRHRDR